MRLVRCPEVLSITGFKKSTLYLRIKQGRFPRPVPLGGSHAVAWPSDEVDRWVADTVAAARPQLARSA